MNEKITKKILTFTFVIFSMSIGIANAALYKWTDTNGKVHYSTSIPPDAVKGEYEKMDKGLGKKSVSGRELTKEEVEQLEVQKKKALEAEKLEKELNAKRQAILQRYRAADEFDLEIEKIDTDYKNFISKTQTEIDNYKKQIISLSSSANPDRVEIARVRKEIEDRKVFIEKRKADKEQKIEKINFEKNLWIEANNLNKK